MRNGLNSRFAHWKFSSELRWRHFLLSARALMAILQAVELTNTQALSPTARLMSEAQRGTTLTPKIPETKQDQNW
jgi:hypothetical protein